MERRYCSRACQRRDYQSHRIVCEENVKVKACATTRIRICVEDDLSGKRHRFELDEDSLVRRVKMELRDAEVPRYRFEYQMGSIYVQGVREGRLLNDFKSLRAQGVKEGDVLRHVVHAPTKLQRSGYDTCPGQYSI